MAITAWRSTNRSTIRNLLGLARTAYLNLADPVGHRRLCQRMLADIRGTRPQLDKERIEEI